MVAYEPPDTVVVAIGAAHRAEQIVKAASRIHRLAVDDRTQLEAVGLGEEDFEALGAHLRELNSMLRDPRNLKNDTPPQMAEVADTMAHLRGWLRTLRLIARVNLAEDAPALNRIISASPEVRPGYPRDMLEESRRCVTAAADLKPRLEDCGLSDAFLGRGRRLVTQLSTAIGKRDLDPGSLTVLVRRFYVRKGQLFLRTRRIARIGELAFIRVPARVREYRLPELEGVRLEPLPNSVRPAR
ncbi:MAG: hypothetical protein AAF449_07165 [Myxococcota bacterium]